MINFFISVTSHALEPFPCLQTVTPSRTPPLERDVLYGRPVLFWKQSNSFPAIKFFLPLKKFLRTPMARIDLASYCSSIQSTIWPNLSQIHRQQELMQ